jgi:glycosyltransferase involved in cell wall biosynthesis
MDMKIGHFNYSQKGGAYIAASRISNAVDPFVEKTELFTAKESLRYKITGKLDHIIQEVSEPPLTTTYLRGLGNNSFRKLNEADIDIKHLHWMPGLSAKSLLEASQVPVVWTLHDMNAFTGICHSSFECEKYKEDCSVCPQTLGILGGIPSLLHSLKKSMITKVQEIVVICPSEWMLSQARQSSIFENIKIEIIRNPLPTNIYRPNGESKPKKFTAPSGKFVAAYMSEQLGVAKGGSTAREILRVFKSRNPHNVEIIEIGNANIDLKPSFVDKCESPSNDQDMAKLLSGCHVLLNTTLAENFPNLLIEAQACGVPVISVDVGGSKETFIPGQTGELCKISEFSDALEFYLRNPEIHSRHKEKAAERAVQEYSLETVGMKYANLYHQLSK